MIEKVTGGQSYEALSSEQRPSQGRGLSPQIAQAEIPGNDDIFSGDELGRYLDALGEPPLSVIAVGDIMLGARTRKVIAERGPDYPFEATQPLLRRAPVVLGNLEGPFARKAHKEERNFSYGVNPKLAAPIKRAGINVLTLANNHLLDCGRAGVLETLDTLALAGIAPLGAGATRETAHAPVIRQAGQWRVGLLGYYWNRRTAAMGALPGSAMDSPEVLKADIAGLRAQVDRVVVTFHWGVPYEREPSTEDRAKARFAVDCGADAVIGHHPHIIQPFEIYRGRPIFYSVGNFAFGSGNSHAEGLLIGLRFRESRTDVNIYPLYVKNRDQRVNYQPKVLKGAGAERLLCRLIEISRHEPGRGVERLRTEYCRASLTLPWLAPGGRE
jgi:poly-gamma-glutamate capsule biosynthesis protein CapA/YwtB (metallophosphatase superfamily)